MESARGSRRCLFRGRHHLTSNRGPFFALGPAQIKYGLKPDEEPGRYAEILLQPQRGVGGHSLPACKDVAQAAAGNGHVSCRRRCGDPAGLQFIVNETRGGIGL